LRHTPGWLGRWWAAEKSISTRISTIGGPPGDGVPDARLADGRPGRKAVPPFDRTFHKAVDASRRQMKTLQEKILPSPMTGVDCHPHEISTGGPYMNLPAKIDAKQRHQDAKTLPAPPAALWTFAVIFAISAI